MERVGGRLITSILPVFSRRIRPFVARLELLRPFLFPLPFPFPFLFPFERPRPPPRPLRATVVVGSSVETAVVVPFDRRCDWLLVSLVVWPERPRWLLLAWQEMAPWLLLLLLWLLWPAPPAPTRFELPRLDPRWLELEWPLVV